MYNILTTMENIEIDTRNPLERQSREQRERKEMLQRIDEENRERERHTFDGPGQKVR